MRIIFLVANNFREQVDKTYVLRSVMMMAPHILIIEPYFGDLNKQLLETILEGKHCQFAGKFLN